MSASQKGKKLSQTTKDKISKGNKGKPKPPFSVEHKENMSKARKGCKAWNKGMTGVVEVSTATREKLSNSHKNLPDDNPSVLSRFKEGNIPHNTGNVLSEETKNKISSTLKTSSYFIENNPNASDKWGAKVIFRCGSEDIDNFKLLCDNENIKYNALRAWSKKHINDDELHPKYDCKIIEIYKLEN